MSFSNLSSYQLSHSILLLHLLSQLFKAVLHALVEGSQVVSHPLSMKGDPSAQQRNLRGMQGIENVCVCVTLCMLVHVCACVCLNRWQCVCAYVCAAEYLPGDEVFEAEQLVSVLRVMLGVLLGEESLDTHTHTRHALNYTKNKYVYQGHARNDNELTNLSLRHWKNSIGQTMASTLYIYIHLILICYSRVTYKSAGKKET